MTNRIVRSLMACLLSAAVTLFPPESQARPRRTGRTAQDYIECMNRTNTPRKVYNFFEDNLKYIPDSYGTIQRPDGQTVHLNDDYMQEPFDTFIRGGGDCKDYARLAQEWLSHHGYESYIIARDSITIGKVIQGHAVCMVREGGKWGYVGNQEGECRNGFNTIEEAMTALYPRWTFYYQLFPDRNAPEGYLCGKIINRYWRDPEDRLEPPRQGMRWRGREGRTEKPPEDRRLFE